MYNGVFFKKENILNLDENIINIYIEVVILCRLYVVNKQSLLNLYFYRGQYKSIEIYGFGEFKIIKFDNVGFVKEDVLRFYVFVKDSVGVQVIESRYKLVGNLLNLFFWKVFIIFKNLK